MPPLFPAEAVVSMYRRIFWRGYRQYIWDDKAPHQQPLRAEEICPRALGHLVLAHRTTCHPEEVQCYQEVYLLVSKCRPEASHLCLTSNLRLLSLAELALSCPWQRDAVLQNLVVCLEQHPLLAVLPPVRSDRA